MRKPSWGFDVYSSMQMITRHKVRVAFTTSRHSGNWTRAVPGGTPDVSLSHMIRLYDDFQRR